MKTKTPACVELQHRGGAAVKRRLRGMSPEAELRYWKTRAEEMRTAQRTPRKVPV